MLNPLQELAHATSICTDCGLHETRNQVVFGRGNEHARIVLVGEAPGKEEDKTGQPFVGRSGQFLTECLKKAGITESSLYICNTVKCRPPDNRNPAHSELMACSPYLAGQLLHIRPQLVVAVGKVALNTLDCFWHDTVLRHDPTVYQILINDCAFPVYSVYHPAYVLRGKVSREGLYIKQLQQIKWLSRVHKWS